jgi:hypothetical protein
MTEGQQGQDNLTCPKCGEAADDIYLGEQPEDGSMDITYSEEKLPGQIDSGSYKISYHFMRGRQSVSSSFKAISV